MEEIIAKKVGDYRVTVAEDTITVSHGRDIVFAYSAGDAEPIMSRQPVEFERAVPTHRRESAVELLLKLGFVWNNRRWEDRRPAAQGIDPGGGHSGQSEGVVMDDFKGDRGPWMVAAGEPGAVMSDDFTHDVYLRVGGDFGSDEARAAYCTWLASTLNAAIWQPIETVPKNGVDVYLGQVGSPLCLVGHWDAERNALWAQGAGSSGLCDDATHWMPLPPGPELP